MNQWMLVSLLSLLSLSAFATEADNSLSPEEKGLVIAKEADRRDQGWGDSSATMKMVLINRQGDQSERQLRLKSLEVADDGDKSLTIFDEPFDVAGTAFLSFTHSLEPDDQWLYLPALKRVKRISSANKSGPFMGSEFAFEDLSSFEVDKFTYEYLRDEPCGELTCHVSKLFPQYEYSGYSYQIVWLDTDEYRAQKIEYYDRKGDLLKTQTFSDYREFLDQYWRAHSVEMVNHQTGKSTRLEWSDYQFNTGLSDADFNRRRLQNSR